MGWRSVGDSAGMLPIKFNAIYQDRVWGGRELENVYGRELPSQDVPYGESWEISDREEAQSVVSFGDFAGMSLNQLWSDEVSRAKVFGDGLRGDRFPLLIKILDCRDDLSVQVHPPAELAEEMGGEAKTEMWYIAGADKGAKLYAGLKRGVTSESFEQSLADGTVEEQIHAIEAVDGESIFIPSGRLHAIGAGYLIYEIQQNSDTTYRVFDWNRMGLDGEPRELHVEQSMRCIDFSDTEPEMDEAVGDCIASCEYFKVEKRELHSGTEMGNLDNERFSIVTVVSGELADEAGGVYIPGDFIILPRGASKLRVNDETLILQTTIPVSKDDD